MEFEQLESAREAYAKKIRIMIACGVAILIFCLVMGLTGMFSFKHGLNQTVIAIMGIGVVISANALIIGLIISRKVAKAYKKLYKAYFVERSLNQVFTNIHYDHTAGIPASVLAQTDMINTGDTYSSNDFFAGKYHDVALSQADVHISIKSTDSDGNTTYTTIFKGRWMIFEFPKQFSFRLQVVDKHFSARKKPNRDPKTGRKIEKISTESTTFNKQFKVYAEDGFEAYYILDPAFIDHIETLNNSHKGRLLLCFIDNKLSVGIDDRSDAFEAPSPLKPIDETKELAKVKQDIKTITDFVDFLKLDRKLFKTT